MSRRLPGNKVRLESFHVLGQWINVELRVDGHDFYVQLEDGVEFRTQTLADLRAQVQPHLEVMHRLEYDPVIIPDFSDPERNSRFDNHRDGNRQDLEVDFSAGWISRQFCDLNVDEKHYWIETGVDDDDQILPPSENQLRKPDRTWDKKKAVPFTTARWRRIKEIGAAVKAVRMKIAEVLSDQSGMALDGLRSLSLSLALPPSEDSPVVEKPKGTTKSKRRRSA